MNSVLQWVIWLAAMTALANSREEARALLEGMAAGRLPQIWG
jgi:hypothetical protein